MRHAAAAMAIVGLTTLVGLQAQDGPDHAGKDISIGGEGGWDYLTIDAAAHRLYVSHATHAVVIDTLANKVVGEIPDTPGIHGIPIGADLGKGFTSNGRENKASIFDLKTLKLVQKVDTGENPDAILYEPARKEVYTMNGRGKSATVLKVVQTLKTHAGARTMALDPATHTIYLAATDYEPQPAGSKARPKAVAGTFRVLTFQMK